jgi:diacylglycerol kinase family enzyme
LIEICIFPRVGWSQFLKVLWGLWTGRVPQSCGTVEMRAPSLTLTSSQRVLLQLDGENVGELPASISLQPKALRVICP